MKLFIFLMTVFFSLQVFPQTREELLEEFMKERRKMMESMMDLFNDSFEEDFFDTTDPFGDMKRFMGVGSNVSIEEKYEEDGSISILIKPQNKNVDMDIQTTNDRITITSKVRQETTTDENGNSFKSMSMSSSSKSIGIPSGYTAKSPEAVDGGIKISLVPTDKVKDIMDKKEKKKLLKKDPSMI